MARRNSQGVRYPDEMMEDVHWSFTGRKFSSLAKFLDAVQKYQGEVMGEEGWQPNEVVLRSRRVRVEHEFGEGPQGVWGGSPPSFSAVAEFAADGPDGFTAGELLFKVHNAFVEQLREGDHVFFEGFCLMEAPGGDLPPLYDIDLGS